MSGRSLSGRRRSGLVVLGVGLVLLVAAVGYQVWHRHRTPSASAETLESPAVLGPAGQCGTQAKLRGQGPAAVVIVLDGVPTAMRAGDWQPLTVSACPVDANGATTAWPLGAVDGLRRFSMLSTEGATGQGHPPTSQACAPGSGFGHGVCLTEEIARTGAITIPYSYAGVTFTGTGLGVVAHNVAYDGPDSEQDVTDSVADLARQISSLEAVWPDTRIVVLGHSWGGLIATQWWEQHHGAQADPHVTAVFSLDGAINGANDCTLFAPLAPAALQQCSDLHDGRFTRDQQIADDDADGTLHIIGTVGDPAYNDSSGGGDVLDQALFRCEDVKTCLLPPAQLSPCDPNHAIYGTIGHDLVKACPQVLTPVRSAVQAAVDHP